MTDEPQIGQATERFCHNCGAPNPDEYSFCLRCGVRINFARSLPVVAARAPALPLPGAYPVRFEADCPEQLSRWSTFFRLAAVFPVLWISFLFSSLVPEISFVSFLFFLPFLPLYWFLTIVFFFVFWCLLAYWITVLLRGRPVRWLFDALVASQRFFVRAYTYLVLMTDRYPPFEGEWPVRFEVDLPARVSRWQLLFWKSAMSLPHLIVLTVLSIVVGIVTLVAWFAIMFTGRYPKGLYNFVAGWMRWYSRVGAYWMSLTDEFPPFDLSAEARKGSRRAYVLSALAGAGLLTLAVGGCAAAVATFPEGETTEIEVSYAGLRAGRASQSATVSGIKVRLLEVEDPHEPPISPGARLVQFTIQMENEDAFFAYIDENDFLLTDTFGESYGPSFLSFRGSDVPPFDFDRGDRGELLITFELDDLANPAELEYEPLFALFGSFDERVRFKFTRSEVGVSRPRTRTPTPAATPRSYGITVRVDFGSIVPQGEPVDIAGLRIDPIEVEDPHPTFSRAPLPDRPPDPGTRYVAFYLSIQNVNASNLIITADNFNLTHTLGGGLSPDFLTFGGSLADTLTLEARPPSIVGTLVGLVFELDDTTDPVGLTYFPQFEDPFAGNHNVHYDFQ